MPARLLVVGWDAVESTVVDDLLAQGRLPNLAGLLADGATAALRPECMDRLPGAIWQDLTLGVSVGRHGDYYPDRLHTGDAVVRSIDPAQHAAAYYWAQAGRAGRKVAVIDQPLVPELHSEDVTLVSEWHVHDQLWGRGTHPEGLLAELEAAHGHRPLDRCDWAHDDSTGGYSAWLDRVLEEMRIKTDMAIDVLDRDGWDLFQVAFSDGHCAGHQLWHFRDPRSPAHVPDAPPALRDAVDDIYVQHDVALGRLLDAADAETVVVVTSHGMDAYVGGPQLVGPVLRAAGMGDARKLPAWLRPLIPVRQVQALVRRVPAARSAFLRSGVTTRGFLRPGTLAIEVQNNRVGAVRLNLIGREPAGEVAPADAPALLDRLESVFMALRQVGSGEPVVHAIHRTEEVYGPDRHPDLPDLLIEFRRDLGELVHVESAEVGRLHVEFRRPDYPRTGDHTRASRLWLRDGVDRGGADLGEHDVLAFAPTMLALLGVESAVTFDAEPIAAVLPEAVQR